MCILPNGVVALHVSCVNIADDTWTESHSQLYFFWLRMVSLSSTNVEFMDNIVDENNPPAIVF
jgi:hypothetical protein